MGTDPVSIRGRSLLAWETATKVGIPKSVVTSSPAARPTGVADDRWAELSRDPTAKDSAALAEACTTLTPMSASDINGPVGFGAGTKAEEWKA